MEVKFDESICKQAGECVKGLPEVFFVADGSLVIDTSKASEESILQTLEKCPSGALKCVD